MPYVCKANKKQNGKNSILTVEPILKKWKTHSQNDSQVSRPRTATNDGKLSIILKSTTVFIAAIQREPKLVSSHF